jgi:sugar lactone lactonase YvrE
LEGAALTRTGTFVREDAAPGKPDGIAEDTDGNLWSARFGGGAVVRIAPGGRVTGIVRVGATQVTSCCFGGADMRTLFITTSQRMLSPEALRAQPHAGDCFAVQLPMSGKPVP